MPQIHALNLINILIFLGCRECKQFKFEEETEPPFVLYERVMSSDTHVREWLEHIVSSHFIQWIIKPCWLPQKWLYGFCLVKNVPATPEATRDLLERIAHIRHTHYGAHPPSSKALKANISNRWLLGFHRRPDVQGYCIHQRRACSAHRQHLLQRPGKTPAVPSPVSYRWIRRRKHFTWRICSC